MTYTKKYFLSGSGVACAAVTMIFAIGAMQSAFVGSDADKAKFWFGILLAALAVGLVCAVLFKYYKARRYSDTKTQEQIAVETLNQLAQNDKDNKTRG